MHMTRICNDFVSRRFSTGMFDYRDLVVYLLIVFHKNQWKEEEADVDIKEIVRRALSLEPVHVKLVAGTYNIYIYSIHDSHVFTCLSLLSSKC